MQIIADMLESLPRIQRPTFYTKNELELLIGCYFSEDEFNEILKLTNFHVIMRHNNVKLAMSRPAFYLIGAHAGLSQNSYFTKFTSKKLWRSLNDYDHSLIDPFNEMQARLFLSFPDQHDRFCTPVKTYHLDEVLDWDNAIDRILLEFAERNGDID